MPLGIGLIVIAALLNCVVAGFYGPVPGAIAGAAVWLAWTAGIIIGEDNR